VRALDHHLTVLQAVPHNTVLQTVLSGIQNTVPDDLFVTRAAIAGSV
jgi:hypothetical protein